MNIITGLLSQVFALSIVASFGLHLYESPWQWTALYVGAGAITIWAACHAIECYLYARGVRTHEKNNEALRAAQLRMRRLAGEH